MNPVGDSLKFYHCKSGEDDQIRSRAQENKALGMRLFKVCRNSRVERFISWIYYRLGNELE